MLAALLGCVVGIRYLEGQTMPNWADPADVRRWIAEREEEENQDKVRNWRGGQGIGPKTREEYEADLAAARQDAGRAASWRAPHVKSYYNVLCWRIFCY